MCNAGVRHRRDRQYPWPEASLPSRARARRDRMPRRRVELCSRLPGRPSLRRGIFRWSSATVPPKPSSSSGSTTSPRAIGKPQDSALAFRAESMGRRRCWPSPHSTRDGRRRRGTAFTTKESRSTSRVSRTRACSWARQASTFRPGKRRGASDGSNGMPARSGLPRTAPWTSHGTGSSRGDPKPGPTGVRVDHDNGRRTDIN